MGCRLVIGFIEHLQILTTSNYSHIINSQTLLFTTQEDDGSVVYSCCWALASAVILWSEPRGTRDLFYCIRFETRPTWKSRSPYFYPPGTRWPSYIPRHWVRSSHTQSYITTDSQSASPSWCQAAIWDPRPIFPILSLSIFYTFLGLLMCSALSDEKSGL
jgi:hypothetical protein